MTRHIIRRTHKITLYPTPEQRRTLARNAGYPRLVYNWTLGYHERTLCDPSQLFTFWDAARTAAYPWSDELSQNAAKHAVYALEKAIKASEDTNRKNDIPKLHRRKERVAFRAASGADTVKFEGMGIKLPGIGAILTREDLRFRGCILTVTVEREAGRWFACVTVECKAPEACPGTELIGVDVGGRKIAACSDGTTYPAPKALRHQWGKIRRYRKHLARQTKGSAQRRCMLRKLRRATYRAACLREEAQHQAANKIFAKGRTVVLETLDFSALMEKGGKRCARGISAAAMRRMQRKITYRYEAVGVKVIKAPPGFASSQICSDCGNPRTGKMRLRDEEEYKCHRCGLVIDRDVNAGKNLKRYGQEHGL